MSLRERMTPKRLSPERLTEYVETELCDWIYVGLDPRELFGHIDALESELNDYAKALADVNEEGLATEKELAEARAEIERLRGK